MALAASGLGIRARGTMPMRGAATGGGAQDLPVTLAGVHVAPGDIVLADADGVVVAHAERAAAILDGLHAWLDDERTGDGR